MGREAQTAPLGGSFFTSDETDRGPKPGNAPKSVGFSRCPLRPKRRVPAEGPHRTGSTAYSFHPRGCVLVGPADERHTSDDRPRRRRRALGPALCSREHIAASHACRTASKWGRCDRRVPRAAQVDAPARQIGSLTQSAWTLRASSCTTGRLGRPTGAARMSGGGGSDYDAPPRMPRCRGARVRYSGLTPFRGAPRVAAPMSPSAPPSPAGRSAGKR